VFAPTKSFVHTVAVGVDLQKEVYEDMMRNFAAYPHQWSMPAPDPNIDHRRVPNLMTFFSSKGETFGTSRSEIYAPGDLVTWDLGGNVPHIGIVVDRKSPASGRYMLVHNIGEGPRWKTSSSIDGAQIIRLADHRRLPLLRALLS
jgi:uncharacterized protein YijF (DUF1287 family)